LNDPTLTEEEAEEKASVFVLLDDVISDSRLKHDSNLMELFVAGRRRAPCRRATSCLRYAHGPAYYATALAAVHLAF